MPRFQLIALWEPHRWCKSLWFLLSDWKQNINKWKAPQDFCTEHSSYKTATKGDYKKRQSKDEKGINTTEDKTSREKKKKHPNPKGKLLHIQVEGGFQEQSPLEHCNFPIIKGRRDKEKMFLHLLVTRIHFTSLLISNSQDTLSLLCPHPLQGPLH